MQKNKYILSKILTLLIISTNILIGDPDWDTDGDCVIDNYNFYEFNGTITSRVFTDNQEVGDFGDLVGVFVNDELRGVGCADDVPEFLGGGYAFLTMVYSNTTSGETLTFQYYDYSTDSVHDINETLPWEVNMVEGDVIDAFILTYDVIDDTNIWDSDADCVVDNYPDFEYNGTITARVYDGDMEVADIGDLIAAFVNNEIRGVSCADEVPEFLGGGFAFTMMVYSNNASSETFTFEFYDYSNDLIYNLNETLPWEINMVEGNVTDAFILTIDDNTSTICEDENACNFGSESDCTYPENNYDCQGNCTVDVDCNGVCGGNAQEDCLGTCGGPAFYDECDICIIDIEEACLEDCAGVWGGSAEEDECGVCDGDNSTCEDCSGTPNGNAFLDECGECISDIQDACTQDCLGEWGGSAYIDNCGICVGGNTNLEPCENFTFNLPLHVGSNLVSFYGLPLDASLESIMLSNPNDYIFAIIGENTNAYNEGNNTWEGSLDTITETGGYWFKTLNTMDFVLDNVWNTSNQLHYNLNIGTNLISFPSNSTVLLDNVIPNEFLEYIDVIIGESVIAVKDDSGGWIGSLESLSGSNGYYFILNAAINDFYYSIDQNTLSQNIISPVEQLHFQSSLQSFYIVDNISDLNLEEGDWILAYNNETLVGSREWNPQTMDIPVMGNDGTNQTEDYCQYADTPIFKILKRSGDIINLYGDIPSFENLKISYIDLSAFSTDLIIPSDINISNVYPNPFNPTVNFDIEVYKNNFLSLYIVDINGRVVDELYKGNIVPGIYSYIWNADGFSSGIYFIHLQTNDHFISKKISLIK